MHTCIHIQVWFWVITYFGCPWASLAMRMAQFCWTVGFLLSLASSSSSLMMSVLDSISATPSTCTQWLKQRAAFPKILSSLWLKSFANSITPVSTDLYLRLAEKQQLTSSQLTTELLLCPSLPWMWWMTIETKTHARYWRKKWDQIWRWWE